MNQNNIKPIFKDNYVAVVFSASNYYVPYLTVALQSLSEHSSNDIDYDIVILNKDITTSNQEIVVNHIAKKNISVRFVDVSSMLVGNDTFVTTYNISIETYFRFFLPQIMQGYDRVLYLDSDLIIKDDISNLFFLDMRGYPVAASIECLMSAVVNIFNQYEYFYNTLNLTDVNSYFQAGVMLLDIPKLLKMDFTKKTLKMAHEYNYGCLDQDILNKLFSNNYFLFDNKWNFSPLQHHMKTLNYLQSMSEKVRAKYLSVTSPKIIHYADRGKPWLDPSQDMAEQWWQYARNTPFYELLLYRMQQDQIKNALDIIKNYGKYRLKCFIYKLLGNKNKVKKYQTKLIQSNNIINIL